jgi:hypothetical protein
MSEASASKRLLGIAAVGVLVAVGCGSDETKTSDSASSTTATSATGTPSERGIEIAGYGFTQLPPDSGGASYLSYAVVVRNVSADQIQTTRLNVALLDSAGSVVKTEEQFIGYVPPGGTAASSSIVTIAGVAKMTVQATPLEAHAVTQPVGAFKAEDIETVERQNLGDLHTTCTLESTWSKDLTQVYVAAVYYDSANQIIGGANSLVDIAANGRAAVEMNGPDLGAIPARTEVYANAIKGLRF